MIKVLPDTWIIGRLAILIVKNIIYKNNDLSKSLSKKKIALIQGDLIRL